MLERLWSNAFKDEPLAQKSRHFQVGIGEDRLTVTLATAAYTVPSSLVPPNVQVLPWASCVVLVPHDDLLEPSLQTTEMRKEPLHRITHGNGPHCTGWRQQLALVHRKPVKLVAYEFQCVLPQKPCLLRGILKKEAWRHVAVGGDFRSVRTCLEICSLANGKAVGPEMIPAEILKVGSFAMAAKLYDLLTRIWRKAY